MYVKNGALPPEALLSSAAHVRSITRLLVAVSKIVRLMRAVFVLEQNDQLIAYKGSFTPTHSTCLSSPLSEGQCVTSFCLTLNLQRNHVSKKVSKVANNAHRRTDTVMTRSSTHALLSLLLIYGSIFYVEMWERECFRSELEMR
jgi:hypothetical protein